MKLIKEGIIPEREMRATCWFCKAEFEFTADDLAIMFPLDLVMCPCCAKPNELERSDMPKGMLIEIKKHENKNKKEEFL